MAAKKAGNDRLLRSEEAAQLLGITDRTLRRWRAAGRGPAYVQEANMMLRYRESAVRAWIKTNEKAPGAKRGK